jgi:CDP-glucose 4,6-dehydratase
MTGAPAFSGVFAGKSVLVTGQTGFKGAWLSLWLLELGATVSGLALEPETDPNLHDLLGLSGHMDSRIGDVRDSAAVGAVFREAKPDFVFHLAAQALVRRSYREPVHTFGTNVMGTANVLEAARGCDRTRVVVTVTSDKCYRAPDSGKSFREDDALGGHDPYSASKACAEHVVGAFRDSFSAGDAGGALSLSSARAGNVIGGGDWSEDRILPDCVRALSQGKPVELRNPGSVRPWQHVLDPLSGYLRLAQKQTEDPVRYADAFNFGPDPDGDATVADLVDRVIARWGEGASAVSSESMERKVRESVLLRLDCTKARETLGWTPSFDFKEAVEATVDWYRAFYEGGTDLREYSAGQISAFSRKGACASR